MLPPAISQETQIKTSVAIYWIYVNELYVYEHNSLGSPGKLQLDEQNPVAKTAHLESLRIKQISSVYAVITS